MSMHPALEPTAVRPGTGRRLEHTVVGEQAHQSVEVMAVPRVGCSMSKARRTLCSTKTPRRRDHGIVG